MSKNESANLDPIVNGRGYLVAGIALIAASLLAILAMFYHPTGRSHHMADFVDEVARERFINALVHGGAIGLVGVFLFAFCYLSDWLGSRRVLVRSGLIAFGIGILAMIAAATVSGFIVPSLLARFGDASDAELEMARYLLVFAREVNRACDHLGVSGMSAGVLLWSIAMLVQRRAWWATGTVGVIVGAFGIIGLFTGHTTANVHGIIVFVLLQGTWNSIVGVQLIRASQERPNPTTG